MKLGKPWRFAEHGDGLEVGFYGRVARIARVHQYGLRDRVVAGGNDVQYEQRRVLGINPTTTKIVFDTFNDLRVM